MSQSDVAGIKQGKAAIFRALQLGDLLCAIPAVRALKEYCPDLEITLIGLPWAADFADRFSRYFSSFIPFPGYAGLVEQPYIPAEFEVFAMQVKEADFDLVIQMHGNGSVTNAMVNKLHAGVKAGYFPESEKACGRFFMRYPEGMNEVERHMKLMEFLGVPLRGKELEFQVTRDEVESARRLRREFALEPMRYVCIHPGARDVKRRWRPEYFALIADEIVDHGFKVVLTGTSAEEKVVEEVVNKMRHPAVNLAGKTELGVLAALIGDSRLLICNDTGVSHIAAALGSPSVVIFLQSDPERWAPLNPDRHGVILPHEADRIDHVLLNVRQKLLDTNVNKNSLRVA